MAYPAFGKHCAEQGTCKSKNSRETAKEKSLFLKKKQRFFCWIGSNKRCSPEENTKSTEPE